MDQQTNDKLEKWRLILGSKADPEGKKQLSGKAQGMDRVLEALYESNRKGGLGRTSPNVNRWLGDIRKYFPTSVVQLMQKDALERLQLEQMLLEPELLETIEADVNLVATLISLNKVLPNKTKDTARIIIKKVVQQLEKKLQNPMREALTGRIYRATRKRNPKFKDINWHLTIRANLKHYQESLHTIIPETLIGFGKRDQQLKHIVLLVDQSGSMATSVVYAGILGCIMASLRTVKTTLVVFDTSIADLSEKLDDPVEILFATQLGGGTDINKALAYIQPLIQSPSETVLVLISDLFEGGNAGEMLRRLTNIKARGTQCISLLALNDEGAPAYDHDIAAKLAQLDITAFACTPELFPDLMATAINQGDLKQWLSHNQLISKN